MRDLTTIDVFLFFNSLKVLNIKNSQNYMTLWMRQFNDKSILSLLKIHTSKSLTSKFKKFKFTHKDSCDCRKIFENDNLPLRIINFKNCINYNDVVNFVNKNNIEIYNINVGASVQTTQTHTKCKNTNIEFQNNFQTIFNILININKLNEFTYLDYYTVEIIRKFISIQTINLILRDNLKLENRQFNTKKKPEQLYNSLIATLRCDDYQIFQKNYPMSIPLHKHKKIKECDDEKLTIQLKYTGELIIIDNLLFTTFYDTFGAKIKRFRNKINFPFMCVAVIRENTIILVDIYRLKNIFLKDEFFSKRYKVLSHFKDTIIKIIETNTNKMFVVSVAPCFSKETDFVSLYIRDLRINDYFNLNFSGLCIKYLEKQDVCDFDFPKNYFSQINKNQQKLQIGFPKNETDNFIIDHSIGNYSGIFVISQDLHLCVFCSFQFKRFAKLLWNFNKNIVSFKFSVNLDSKKEKVGLVKIYFNTFKNKQISNILHIKCLNYTNLSNVLHQNFNDC